MTTSSIYQESGHRLRIYSGGDLLRNVQHECPLTAPVRTGCAGGEVGRTVYDDFPMPQYSELIFGQEDHRMADCVLLHGKKQMVLRVGLGRCLALITAGTGLVHECD